MRRLPWVYRSLRFDRRYCCRSCSNVTPIPPTKPIGFSCSSDSVALVSKFCQSGTVRSHCDCFQISPNAKIRRLIALLQGVHFGIAGGVLYFPILKMLPQWFVRRRGLATGIIFAGPGIGGTIASACHSFESLTSSYHTAGFEFSFLLQTLLARDGFRWTL